MAGFGEGAGMTIVYEPGNIFTYVDPEVPAAQNLVRLSGTWVSN